MSNMGDYYFKLQDRTQISILDAIFLRYGGVELWTMDLIVEYDGLKMAGWASIDSKEIQVSYELPRRTSYELYPDGLLVQLDGITKNFLRSCLFYTVTLSKETDFILKRAIRYSRDGKNYCIRRKKISERGFLWNGKRLLNLVQKAVRFP